MLSEKLLHQLLKKNFSIKASELKKYSEKAKKMGKTLEEYLLYEKIVDEVKLYSDAAKKMKVLFVDLKNRDIKKETLNLVPPAVAQAHNIIAFDKNNREVKLATLDPQDIQTIEFLHRKIGLNPKVYLTNPDSIKGALRRYHADLEGDVTITQLKTGKSVGAGELKKAAEELPRL